MKAVWQKERQVIAEIRKVKEEIEATKTEAELAQRKGDFNRAAELRFGRLPELEKRLAAKDAELKAAQKGGSFLREEVTEEDIAAVVSKWTGIPVEKMLEGEQSRLGQMEERLHQRVVGQDEAVERRRQRRPPGARRAAGPQPAHRLVHLPGADRRRQDRAGAGAGRVPVRRRDPHGPHRHVRVHGEARGLAADRARLPATSATTRAAS